MPSPASPITTPLSRRVLNPKAGIGVQSASLVVLPLIGPKLDETVRSGFMSSKPISRLVPSNAASPAGLVKKEPRRL